MFTCHVHDKYVVFRVEANEAEEEVPLALRDEISKRQREEALAFGDKASMQMGNGDLLNLVYDQEQADRSDSDDEENYDQMVSE